MSGPFTRREWLGQLAAGAVGLVLPASLACGEKKTVQEQRTEAMDSGAVADPDRARLATWTKTLRAEGLTRDDVPLGKSATRAGELAEGTPYEAYTLEAYLRGGGSPRSTEPLTLWLTRFDCVSLVESCLAVARVADDPGAPTWERFGQEIERMRYRGGKRQGYGSRLHYFSEWIADGARRGLLHDLSAELGGIEDARPLRFMTEHRASYPALADEEVFRQIGVMERGLDQQPRRVIPKANIAKVADRIESGDVLAFATSIPGLDVTHSAFAYRDASGALRVLHAPLSGGVVEVSRLGLPEYVAAIKRATGVLIARPVRA